MVKKFEETEVWKASRELVNLVYKLTNKTQFKRDYALVDQIRRSPVSIVSNIAEGFERGSNTELMHFLYIAKGSAGELRAQMYIALDQKYIIESDLKEVRQRCQSISAQIAGLISYLKRSNMKGAKFSPPGNK